MRPHTSSSPAQSNTAGRSPAKGVTRSRGRSLQSSPKQTSAALRYGDTTQHRPSAQQMGQRADQGARRPDENRPPQQQVPQKKPGVGPRPRTSPAALPRPAKAPGKAGHAGSRAAVTSRVAANSSSTAQARPQASGTRDSKPRAMPLEGEGDSASAGRPHHSFEQPQEASPPVDGAHAEAVGGQQGPAPVSRAGATDDALDVSLHDGRPHCEQPSGAHMHGAYESAHEGLDDPSGQHGTNADLASQLNADLQAREILKPTPAASQSQSPFGTRGIPSMTDQQPPVEECQEAEAASLGASSLFGQASLETKQEAVRGGATADPAHGNGHRSVGRRMRAASLTTISPAASTSSARGGWNTLSLHLVSYDGTF